MIKVVVGVDKGVQVLAPVLLCDVCREQIYARAGFVAWDERAREHHVHYACERGLKARTGGREYMGRPVEEWLAQLRVNVLAGEPVQVVLPPSRVGEAFGVPRV